MLARIGSRERGGTVRLKDKIALVTGAAKGIGAACARRFVDEGARVLLVDIDEEHGRATADSLGASAAFVAGNVADGAFAAAAVREAVKRFGRLDILLNNAGITHAAAFLELAEADFDRVLSVNLKSYFLFGQAAARQMVAQGAGGAIVNMSSVNAILAIPDQVPYVVSKGAVNQLTRVMAMALAPHSIRVNAIGPGTIATELARKAVMGSEEARRKLLSRTPMKRLGEPDEVAKVAVFLAGDDASYMTGQTVYPDGGRLALNYTVPVDD
jgi:NAD(P)-dependent dehydrogenase (short-subunit alcohol dehydrogenase family)